MDNEDYLTPLVTVVVAGVIKLGVAYIGLKLIDKYADMKLAQLEKERSSNTEVPIQ